MFKEYTDGLLYNHSASPTHEEKRTETRNATCGFTATASATSPDSRWAWSGGRRREDTPEKGDGQNQPACEAIRDGDRSWFQSLRGRMKGLPNQGRSVDGGFRADSMPCAACRLPLMCVVGQMRSAFMVSVLLLCGCGTTHPAAKPDPAAQETVFDVALAEPRYSDAIRQAEREVPGDERIDKPFPANVSRERREYQVATNILAELKPKLKQMSVTELVLSLKIESAPGVVVSNDFSGVASDVYVGGYNMIKKEILSRPKKQLQVLPGLADGSVWLYTGPQGPPVTRATFVQIDLYEE